MWILKIMMAGRWERVGTFKTRSDAERAGMTHVGYGEASRYQIIIGGGFNKIIG